MGWSRRLLLPLLCLTACTGVDTPPATIESASVELLDAAWLQERWWIAQAGETVESLDWWEEEGGRSPLVQLRSASGARRAVVVEGLGAAREVAAVSAPRASESSVASSVDERWRVRVSTDARIRVELIDMVSGARETLFDEVAAGRRFRHPSVHDGVVFVEWVGAGIVRLDRSGSPPTRVVAQAEARQPHALPGPHSQVLYVEQRAGEPAELRVARPLPEIDLAWAADLRDRLPTTLRDAVRGWDGRWRRAVPCADPGVLRIDTADDRWVFEGAATFEADAVSGCGSDCWLLLGRREGGGRVLRAKLARQQGGWWLTPAGAPRQGFVDPAEIVLTVDGCGPRRDPDLWLQLPVHLAPAGDALVGIERGQGGLMRAYALGAGRRRAQPYQVVFEAGGTLKYVQRTANPVVFPKGATAARAAGTSANVVDGVLRWDRRGEVRDLVGPSDTREPGHMSLSHSGAELLWDEAGELPGVWRAVWGGEPSRIASDAGARAPIGVPGSAGPGAAWLDELDGRALLVVGRPLRDDEASAWDAGAATLLDLPLAWLVVGNTGDGCASGMLRVSLDEGGAPVLDGQRQVPVRAGVARAGVLHLLGPSSGGAPRRVLSLLPQPDGSFVPVDPLGITGGVALWPRGAEGAPDVCGSEGVAD